MKHRNVLAFCCLSLLLAGRASAQGARELKLGNATGSLGQDVSVGVTLTSDSQVQGLVVAGDWDGSQLKGSGLTVGAAIAGADTVVPRIADSFFVLGVVMDSNGVGGEIITPGKDLPVCTVKV